LDSKIRDRLKVLSQQNGTTMFMTLSAAFKVLLFKYSGQNDFVIGSAIAGRQQTELEQMIGFFVNTIALRDTVDETETFNDFLAKVKITTLEAFENQEAPFEKVVETVKGERDLGTDPLVQVVFTWQNTPDVPELNIGESRIVGENYEHTTALFDLFLSMSENSKGIHGYFEYNIDLFKRSSIEQLCRHFEKVLQTIIEKPGVKIQDIDLLSLSKEEKHQLLDVFNSKTIKYPMEQRPGSTLFERSGYLKLRKTKH
jgi:non-ribosomal peptide synthetase component F